VHKAAARTKDTEASQYEISQDDLRAALEKVKKEELPRSQEQSEAYFMGQVNLGEQLSSQGQSPAGLFARPIPDFFFFFGIAGPNSALQAALCFYRALRVYPSPVELIVIYQKTVPEPIFKVRFCVYSLHFSLSFWMQLVMALTNLDVSSTSSPPPHGSSPLSDEEASSASPGPPSEASSQEWDKVADSSAQTSTP
jgi:import receptor subunit TOM20